MNRKTRQKMGTLLNEIYASPKPLHKDEFLKKYRKLQKNQKINTWQLLWTQIGYIRKSVWLITLFVFLLGVAGIHAGIIRTINLVSACMPFVSGFAVMESFRSQIYNMADMEKAARFSLKGILFARIAAIGTSHLAFLLCMTLFIGKSSGYGYLMTGAAITIPYLTSSVLSMAAERTWTGRKNEYACIGISAITSMIVIAAQMDARIFDPSRKSLWLWGTLMLVMAQAFELRKLFCNMEAI